MPGQHGTGQHERRDEHHVDQVAPALDREGLDRRDVLEAGVVDQDVDRAELVGATSATAPAQAAGSATSQRQREAAGQLGRDAPRPRRRRGPRPRRARRAPPARGRSPGRCRTRRRSPARRGPREAWRSGPCGPPWCGVAETARSSQTSRPRRRAAARSRVTAPAVEVVGFAHARDHGRRHGGLAGLLPRRPRPRGRARHGPRRALPARGPGAAVPRHPDGRARHPGRAGRPDRAARVPRRGSRGRRRRDRATRPPATCACRPRRGGDARPADRRSATGRGRPPWSTSTPGPTSAAGSSTWPTRRLLDRAPRAAGRSHARRRPPDDRHCCSAAPRSTTAPGSAPRRGDVAVAGGRIVAPDPDAVGAGDAGRRRGRPRRSRPGSSTSTPTPTARCPRIPGAINSISQGVTTEVIGNCGYTPAPVSPVAELANELHLQTQAIGPDLDWSWSTFGSYLDRLDAARPAHNVVPLAGFGALRIAAMGMADRPATPDEVETMRGGPRRGARRRRVGHEHRARLSTRVLRRDRRDRRRRRGAARPRRAVRLAHPQRGRRAGRGGRRGDRDRPAARASASRSRTSSRSACATTGRIGRALERIDAARAAGGRVAFDVYPYTAGSTMLTQVLPPWLQDAGQDGCIDRLRQAEVRARLRHELDPRPARASPTTARPAAAGTRC